MQRKENRGVGSKRAWAVVMRRMPCRYCGKTPAETIDHVVPVSKGGPTTEENCVPSCEPCNQTRAPKRRSQCWTLADKYGMSFGM